MAVKRKYYNLTEEERKHKIMEVNRISARRSAEKKKMYLKKLEDENQQMKESVQTYRDLIGKLKEHMENNQYTESYQLLTHMAVDLENMPCEQVFRLEEVSCKKDVTEKAMDKKKTFGHIIKKNSNITKKIRSRANMSKNPLYLNNNPDEIANTDIYNPLSFSDKSDKMMCPIDSSTKISYSSDKPKPDKISLSNDVPNRMISTNISPKSTFSFDSSDLVFTDDNFISCCNSFFTCSHTDVCENSSGQNPIVHKNKNNKEYILTTKISNNEQNNCISSHNHPKDSNQLTDISHSANNYKFSV